MTDPSNSLEEYIKKQIKSSGFPLEITSSITLSKNRWNVRPHIVYRDEITEEYTELDILATKPSKTVKNARDVLIIECKKQEQNPWVLFEQDIVNENVLSLNIAPMDAYGWFEQYFKNHYYFGRKPCGYHFPTFVKHGKPDVIIDAMLQVANALLFLMGQEIAYIEQQRRMRVSFFYPVILLDGRLFSARVEENGTIKLAESKYLQLRITRALKEPVKITWSQGKDVVVFLKEFIVDIVAKEYLEEFLKNFS